jgi:hypothetical protein
LLTDRQISLIKSLSGAVSKVLTELTRLGRITNKRAANVLAQFERSGHQQLPY